METIQLTVQGRACTFPILRLPRGDGQVGEVAGQPSRETPEWHDALTATLGDYLASFPDEQARLAPLIDSVQGRHAAPAESLGARSRVPGHVTGSGIVVRDGQALLIRHPVIGRWLQPGGHLEGQELPCAAAAREAEEETGWRVAPIVDRHGTPLLLDIDIHAIPENPRKGEPAHWHYDFLYVFAPLEYVATPELEVRWVQIDAVDEPRLTAALAKLPTLHAALGPS